MKKKIFFLLGFILILILVIVYKNGMFSISSNEADKSEPSQEEIRLEGKVQSNINSFVEIDYPFKHIKDICFSNQSTEIYSFVEGRYLLIDGEKGLLMYDLEFDKIVNVPKYLFNRQVVGKYLYGLDNENKLYKIDLVTMEVEQLFEETIYSYVVTSNGVSYQTVNKERIAILVSQGRRFELENIQVCGDDNTSVNPSRVIWAPNGLYALYYEKLKGEDKTKLPQLFLADLEQNKIVELFKSINFIMRWRPNSEFFSVGNMLGSIAVFDRKSKEMIGDITGIYLEHLWGNGCIFGVKRKSKQNFNNLIVKYDVLTKNEFILHQSKDCILDFVFNEKLNLFTFRVPSKNVIFFMNTNGEIKGRITSLDGKKIRESKIDSKGNLAVGYRDGEKYLIKIYNIDFNGVS